MTQPDHIRVSDDERRVIEQVLATAYADGRITADEHSERIDRLWAAKTFGELRPLTSDLVAVEQQVRFDLAPKPADGLPRAVVDTVNPTRDSERLTAIMSSVKRLDSPWRLREHTNITTIMGDAKLDLRNAVFEARTSHIHLMCVMGEVKLYVPAGVRVRIEATTVMGDTGLLGLQPEDDSPEILIDGLVLMGDVKVYGPQHKSWLKRLVS